MSEWQDMQQKPNTKLQDLLKTKQAKTRKLSELPKTEQNRLARLNALLDEQGIKTGTYIIYEAAVKSN